MPDGLSVLEAVLLGVVQGLTEWLPVSSSGHLVLVQEIAGLEATVFFDLLLHVGTLAVVLLFYRDTVLAVLRGLAGAPAALREAGWREVWLADPRRRLAVLVALASVPTAAIGFALEDAFVAAFASTLAVGVGLLATGTWLFLARRAPEPDPERPTWLDALLVGLAQGVAIAPGVSRSGATVGAALQRGVERQPAARFSFLLSAPAIAGATLFRLDEANLGPSTPWGAYLAGTLAAAIVGYAALWLVVRAVERGRFTSFCWYCWALGALAVGVWLA